jgi:hypothetical protein
MARATCRAKLGRNALKQPVRNGLLRPEIIGIDVEILEYCMMRFETGKNRRGLILGR